MKALVKYAKGPGNLEIREVEEPKVSGDLVKIRVVYAGICGILDKPVDFVVMGDDEATVSVEVIFMLAIMKPNDQIEMLSKLVETCQNVSVLQTVKAAEDMDTIEEVMEKLMA